MDNILAKIKGFKTYGSVILSAIACAVLYFTGADTNTLVVVGLAGLLGGTAGLRDAINKETKTSPSQARELVGNILDAFDEVEGERSPPPSK